MSIDLAPNERDFLLNLLIREESNATNAVRNIMNDFKGNKVEIDVAILNIKQNFVYIENLQMINNKLNLK